MRPESIPRIVSFGPRALPGEMRSHHLFRVAVSALAMFALLAAGTVVGAYAFRHQLDEGNPWAFGVFCFGLPVLSGMAALAVLASAVQAVLLRLSGRDRAVIDAESGSA